MFVTLKRVLLNNANVYRKNTYIFLTAAICSLFILVKHEKQVTVDGNRGMF